MKIFYLWPLRGGAITLMADELVEESDIHSQPWLVFKTKGKETGRYRVAGLIGWDKAIDEDDFKN